MGLLLRSANCWKRRGMFLIIGCIWRQLLRILKATVRSNVNQIKTLCKIENLLTYCDCICRKDKIKYY